MPLRVLALTRYGRLGASSRLRTHQFQPVLAKAGLELTVSPLLRDEYLLRLHANKSINWVHVFADYARQLFRLSKARSYDLLWIEKELFPQCPAWFEELLSGVGIPYIVDFDDALFHNYDLGTKLLRLLLPKKIDVVMRKASLVICGNEYLASRAWQTGARRVEIVPTVIDLRRYGSVDQTVRETLVIGWVGQPSGAKYLKRIAPILAACNAKLDLELRVIGAEFSWPGLRVVCKPWFEETEVHDIREFDVGIMPLVDSPWERGKCGYKLIQYMGCALPVIASPVGVNVQIVRQGQNGYLPVTDEDWHDAVMNLGRDPDARRRMGERGRLIVEQEYCIDVAATKIQTFITEVAALRRA